MADPSAPPPELDALRRANAELDRRVFDLQALLKAGEALYDVLDVDALCRLLMAMCRERVRVEKLAVLLHDPEAHRVAVAVAAGLPDEAARCGFPSDDGILWRLLLAGEPFSVVDLAGRPRFPDVFAAHGLEQLDGRHWFPLVMPDRVVGVLSLGANRDGVPVPEAEHAFLAALCDQAAVAVNTARLYQSIAVARKNLDRSLAQLSMLFDVTRALSAVQDLTKLLRLILERAVQAVEAERGSLMLLDERSDELVMRVVLGLPDKEAERKINDGEIACKRWRRGEGVAGRVLETGRAIRVNDTEQDHKFAEGGSSNVKSILCVPLRVDDETIGVVNITNKKGDGQFAAPDEEILGALADQAAVAIRRARLYEAAITDGLTGLYVRRYAMEKLRGEVKKARRYKLPLSVVMCDIDHFKRVNDGHGHPAGDAVIVAVAGALKGGLRTDVDLAGRYGGEEFLLVLPQTPAERAAVAAERLRAQVAGMAVDIGEGKTLQVTMSFGIADLDAEGAADAEGLLKRADEALYQSKQGGRNRVTVCPAAPGSQDTVASGEAGPR